MDSVQRLVQRVIDEELLRGEAEGLTDREQGYSGPTRKLGAMRYRRDGKPDNTKVILERVSKRTGISVERLDKVYARWLGFPGAQMLCGRDPSQPDSPHIAKRGEVFDPAIHESAYRFGVFPRAGFVNRTTPDNKHEVYSESVRAT